MAATNHNVKLELLKQFKVDEEDLKMLCRKMGVKSLAVFGSVTCDEFKVGQSDIDFPDGLRELFQYDKVDLVTVPSLKNQVIRQTIISSQKNIYAA